MKRETMQDWLLSIDPESRLPVWIISYSRAGSAPLLDRADKWRTADSVNVLVRESQRAEYEAAYPNLCIQSQPDSEIGNVGSARWRATQMAYEQHGDMALLLDDDVLHLRFMFEGEVSRGKNIGNECTRHSGLPDWDVLPDLEERVLAGISEVAREIMEEEPNVVLGGVLKQHMSFSPRNHRTKYIINGGVTPRQVMVFNMARMAEAGISLNLDLFGRHGDDIGMAAEILAAEKDCFCLTSFSYDHWDESINIRRSTLRDAETAPALHAAEWEALQQYPIKDYLRTKNSIIDGSFEWGDVNWVKLNKLRGTKTKRVEWDEDSVLESLLI